jgi:hypothetical protein
MAFSVAKLRSIYTMLKFLALRGAPYIYYISRLRVNFIYWDPTYRTHLTYIAQQMNVDRPNDGCVTETCKLVLLTYTHIAVLDCVSLYQ